MHGTVHHLILPAAETVGHGHARTNGQADEEVDHQIGNSAGGAYGCDGHAAAEPPDHHQVCRVEQQLQ